MKFANCKNLTNSKLDHDLTRLPYRNLGRDDRIIANFGREVRYPFLDEGVVRFLSSLRADQKGPRGAQESEAGRAKRSPPEAEKHQRRPPDWAAFGVFFLNYRSLVVVAAMERRTIVVARFSIFVVGLVGCTA